MIASRAVLTALALLAARPAFAAPLFPVSEGLLFGYIDKTGKAQLSRYDDAGDFSEGLAPVKIGRWYGYIDAAGKVAIPPRYTDAGRFSQGRARVRAGSAWGYIDKTGTMVIPLRFFEAADFSEGRASVKEGDRFGMIDAKGAWALDAKYEQLSVLSEGRAAFRQGGKWGYIDKTGKVLIAPQFDGAGDFSGGLAAAAKGAKHGFIDASGKWVVEPKYDGALAFGEGLAPVMTSKRDVLRDQAGRIVKMTTYPRWGYIDATGKEVIATDLSEAGRFSQGLAPVWRDGRFGYIDKAGRFVLETPYSKRAGGFHEGKARVILGMRHGRIDSTGKTAVPQIFADLGDFHDGLAPARLQSGGLWGYIDASGRFAIPPQFDDALEFHAGHARVHKKAWVVFNSLGAVVDQWALIDAKGEIVVKPRFESIAWYTAKTIAGQLDGKLGFFAWSGQPQLEPQFTGVRPVGEDRAVVEKDGKCGLADGGGALTLPPRYDACGWRISEGLLPVAKEGRFGFIAADGTEAVAPQYEAVAGFTPGGLSAVKAGGKWGFIDRTGKVVIAPRYDATTGFFEDRAAVRLGRLWGFIDSSGAALAEPGYQRAGEAGGGLAPVKAGDKWGFVDKSGRLAIPAVFDLARSFEDGLAKVNADGRAAYIDAKGGSVWRSRPDPAAVQRKADMETAKRLAKPASAGMRTIRVMVAADQAARRRPDWRRTAEARVSLVSSVFEKNFKIRFVLAGLVPWETPALGERDDPHEYMSSLTELLHRTVPVLDAEMLIGFTGQDLRGRSAELGMAMPFYPKVLVYDTGVEPLTAAVAVHELLHAFGMFHVQDEKSFMHASAPEGVDASWGMDRWTVDPYTERFLKLTRGFDFAQGMDSLDARVIAEMTALDAEGGRIAGNRAGRVSNTAAWGRAGLGHSLIAQGELMAGLLEYGKAIALDANDFYTYEQFGVDLVRLGSSDEGLENIRRCIELKPEYARCHFLLAAALDAVSAADASFAARLPPPSLREATARYASRADSSEAVAEYRRASRLEPDNAYYRQRLGQALLDRNATAEAVAELRRAAELKPDNGWYAVALENAQRRLAAEVAPARAP